MFYIRRYILGVHLLGTYFGQIWWSRVYTAVGLHLSKHESNSKSTVIRRIKLSSTKVWLDFFFIVFGQWGSSMVQRNKKKHQVLDMQTIFQSFIIQCFPWNYTVFLLLAMTLDAPRLKLKTYVTMTSTDSSVKSSSHQPKTTAGTGGSPCSTLQLYRSAPGTGSV